VELSGVDLSGRGKEFSSLIKRMLCDLINLILILI
jgi:hypothetical protein